MPIETDPPGPLLSPGAIATAVAAFSALFVAVTGQFAKWRSEDKEAKVVVIEGLNALVKSLNAALDKARAEAAKDKADAAKVSQDLQDRLAVMVATNNQLRVYIARNNLPDPPAYRPDDSPLFRAPTPTPVTEGLPK